MTIYYVFFYKKRKTFCRGHTLIGFDYSDVMRIKDARMMFAWAAICNVTLHSYCLKTTHSHVLFFHSHNTLQILIGDSKVTSKLAKINHLFLILWWCLISYFRTLQLVRVVDLFFKLDYFLKTTHSHGLIFHSNITLEILIIES